MVVIRPAISVVLMLGAQDFAALATTSSEDSTSTAGGHASSEAMRLGALPHIWLISTLHCSSLMRPGFGAKPDEYIRPSRDVSTMCWPEGERAAS
jgi:hypothetical protein